VESQRNSRQEHLLHNWGTLVDGGRLEAAIEDEGKGASPLWPVFDVIWADPKVK
jgi:hypothetical protein